MHDKHDFYHNNYVKTTTKHIILNANDIFMYMCETV